MKKILLIVLLSPLFYLHAQIVSNGTGGGAWTSGASWIGGVAPTTSDDVIIQAGDVITTTASLTRGAGTTTTVDGTFKIGAGVTVTGASLIINGTLEANYNSATIPTATWNTNSTLLISGVTSGTSLGNMTQNFYNVRWNCPSQAVTTNMTIGAAGVTWGGKFTLENSNGQIVRFTSNSNTITINGGVEVQAGQLQGTGTASLTLVQNFNNIIISGGSFLPVASTATATLNVNDISVSGSGILSKGSGAVTVNLLGDLSLQGNAQILNNGAGAYTFNFNKSGIATFLKATTATILTNNNNISFNINAGCTIDLGDDVINSNSTASSFIVNSGAGLITGHPDGLYTSGPNGCIRTNTRTFNSNASYEFNGAVAQITGPGLPASVAKLGISNAAGVTITNLSTTITSSLSVNKGTLSTASNTLTLGASASALIGSQGSVTVLAGGVFNLNNRPLIINSTSAGTGSIGQIMGDNITTGLLNATNVTQYREIPAKSARKWSLISSPIAQSLSTGWQQNVHITGAGTGGSPCPSLTQHTNGFDATLTNAPSLFTYDASLPSGNRWVAVANTNATFTEPGKGFRILVRGSRSDGCMLLDGSNPPPSAALLITTGVLSNADKNLGNFTITYNNNLANNWVFVGNPYPSHISFSALRTSNSTKINNTYAIYIPNNPSGVYTYWDGTTFVGGAGGNDATGNVLPNGSAFFVQSIGAGNLDLDFEEAHKTNDDATIYMRNQTSQKQIRVQYKATDNTQLDEVLIKFNAAATNQDIVSMNSGTNFITALKDDKGMVIQHRSDKNLQDDEVKLNVVSTVNGTYKLTFSHYEELQQYTTIFLKDNYTGTTQNIHLLKEGYEFTTDRTKPETSGAGRFSLIFSNKAEPAIAKEIKLYPNPAKNTVSLQLPANQESYTVKVTNISGKVVLQQVIAGVNNTLQLHKLATGTYFVELIDKQGNRTTQKLVKQ